MSKFYRGRRSSNVFDPGSAKPFRLSRTRIDLFLECPRCFYLDRKLGVDRPPGFPFTLNSAVDLLLKREFDAHRRKGEPHPLMRSNGIEAIPFQHEKLNEWRDALRGGISHLHAPTNFLITGGIDDLWINPAGELHVVDYKATAKLTEVSLDADWQAGYKRQAEVYQWLFRQNGFKVSKTAYFVYCNGDLNAERFDQRLQFNVKVLPYEGNDGWIEETLLNIQKCLMSSEIPKAGPDCDFCLYRRSIAEAARAVKT